MKAEDRALGMDRDITRRDFLNGTSAAIGSALLPASPGSRAATAQDVAGSYPPLRGGLRGSHPGSFEVAHLLRDGKRWQDPAASIDTGEDFDLIVVGGGISGLAAAWFYRNEIGPDARILILDNHDDFGGHAKRNEFHIDGRMLVDLGGTEYIEAPWSYPKNAAALLQDLGIDTSRAREVFDHELYPSLNLRCGIFFDKDTFGVDSLVAGAPGVPQRDRQYAYVTLPAELSHGVGEEDAIGSFLERTPLSQDAREQILHLFCGGSVYLDGQPAQEKTAHLRSSSYVDFLRDVVGASQEVIDFFRMWRGSYMGNGTDLTPAFDALRYGLPGAIGLDLVDESNAPDERDRHSYKEDFHFPDGNASIARMLVRRLIPGVAPGDSMHDIVAATFDYSRLDDGESAVRVRLNATAVHVRHMDVPDAVEVTYVQDGAARRIRGRNCVLACYHSIIPYLCPELPDEQQLALKKSTRMPLVSTNVLVRNWKAFEQLGIFAAYCPGSYFSDLRLTYPLRFADYESARTPDEPTTVHLYRIPLPGGGLPGGEQFRAGRQDLLETRFETFERKIRAQLGAMLAEGGFDPARDIEAITVNRWPHGYAVGYDAEKDAMHWFSEPWPEEKKAWLTGRRRFGRIAIANTDAGASAMTEAAIEQAYRATREILDRS